MLNFAWQTKKPKDCTVQKPSLPPPSTHAAFTSISVLQSPTTLNSSSLIQTRNYLFLLLSIRWCVTEHCERNFTSPAINQSFSLISLLPGILCCLLHAVREFTGWRDNTIWFAALSTWPLSCLFVCLSVYLSIHLSVYQSACRYFSETRLFHTKHRYIIVTFENFYRACDTSDSSDHRDTQSGGQHIHKN